MAKDSNENGWPEYQRLVMTKLDEHGRTLLSIDNRQRGMERKIAQLQVKSSVWGGIAGAVVSVPSAFVAWWMNK